MKDYLLRYDEEIKLIKSSMHPIILSIVIYYVIATLTLWPVVVWLFFEMLLLLGMGFILIKDAFLDKLLNRKVEYHTLSSTKNTVSDDEEELDWADFDMTKYPRENYRKIFWEDRARMGVAPGYNKYFLKGYPWGDISVVVWFCLSVFTGYIYIQKEEFAIGRMWLATGGLLVAFLFYVQLEGRKLYIEQCKLNFKCEYLRKQNEKMTIVENRDEIIKMEYSYPKTELDKVTAEERDNILRQLKENDIFLDEACEWYMNHLVHQKDIILLQVYDGVSVCVEKTLEARSFGLPQDYYVLAVQDGMYLCGRRWESALYCFSKGLGITRTTYFSLLEYITQK